MESRIGDSHQSLEENTFVPDSVSERSKVSLLVIIMSFDSTRGLIADFIT